MPLWDCIKALCEGFSMGTPSDRRPIGLTQFHDTDDDLFNQLSVPLQLGGYFQPTLSKPAQPSLPPPAFTRIPTASAYQTSFQTTIRPNPFKV
jgi:hypothetical protein